MMLDWIKWRFAKQRWEIFYNVPNKQIGMRKIKYLGKIRGVDWSNYKTRIEFSTNTTEADLKKLREDIDTILKYAARNNKSWTDEGK